MHGRAWRTLGDNGVLTTQIWQVRVLCVVGFISICDKVASFSILKIFKHIMFSHKTISLTILMICLCKLLFMCMEFACLLLLSRWDFTYPFYLRGGAWNCWRALRKEGCNHLGFMIFGQMMRKRVNFIYIWRDESYKIRQWHFLTKITYLCNLRSRNLISQLVFWKHIVTCEEFFFIHRIGVT